MLVQRESRAVRNTQQTAPLAPFVFLDVAMAIERPGSLARATTLPVSASEHAKRDCVDGVQQAAALGEARMHRVGARDEVAPFDRIGAEGDADTGAYVGRDVPEFERHSSRRDNLLCDDMSVRRFAGSRIPVRTIANSSPPSLATASVGLTALVSRCANW